MERKTISITGLGEFQYTDRFLELAMKRTKADLYAEVCERKVYGRSSMNKEQLAIVLVDGYLQELDAKEAETAIAAVDAKRATGDIPALLCTHGIDAGRRCSICAEDTARKTVGLAPMRNPFAMSHPAANGEVVTEGHTRYCAEFGHATLTTDGKLSAMCPRCGENVHEVPAERDRLVARGRALGISTLWLNSDTDALRELIEKLEDQLTPVRCGRSWLAGDIRHACDVVVTREQINKCGGSLDQPAAGPAHEGPCFDAVRCVWDSAAAERYPDRRTLSMMCSKSFIGRGRRAICGVRQEPGARGNHEGPHYDEFRRVWDDAMTARYHAPEPIRPGDVVVHKIGSAAEFTVSRVHHMHGLMLTDSSGTVSMTWVNPNHVRVVRRGDFFFGGRDLGQARMGFVRAEETRTAMQTLNAQLIAERDAFKHRLMEALVFMTLLADQLEGSGDNALASDVRKFVREAHNLEIVQDHR